jgi:hypothetical protein
MHGELDGCTFPEKKFPAHQIFSGNFLEGLSCHALAAYVHVRETPHREKVSQFRDPMSKAGS